MKIALDSRNHLIYPIISTNVLNELRRMEFVSKTITLKQSKVNMSSATGKDLWIRRILLYKFTIQTKNSQTSPLI